MGNLSFIDVPAMLIAAALLLVAFAHGCGWLARRLGQPAPLGQVCAGLLLSPSLLGWRWPAFEQWLLGMPLRSTLDLLAEAGLGIYLLRAGLDYRRRPMAPLPARLAPAVAFALGALLALWLYPRFGGGAPGFIPFALIVAAGFALWTPASAADLLPPAASEHQQRWAQAQRTAADVSGWLLPLAAAAIWLGGGLALSTTLVYAAALVAAAALLVRPWLARQAGRDLSARLAIKIALLVIAAGAAVELLGLPAPFGALAIGALLAAAHRPAQALDRDLLRPLQTVLLPAFFLGVGLRIDLLSLPPAAPAIIAAAVAGAWIGKGAGALAARRAGPLDGRETLTAAALMNAPAALALFALQLGLERGVLPLPLYSALALALLAAAALALLAVKWVSPQRRSPAARCVLLYRIAP